ncbi:hypothetical protein H1V43_37790 [Streptomyces sp. PSKA54]|uniref:Uncharacterized protein n=1 Tax=Streptomyces himalayensis subsp. aureolus TaxID=2758039 RepID=A0A7W2D986_9ACTN|nr:hypothetical protein [Streptomyces himalayensis]MBA4866951.1 hypothetical protein [Streptomyces himalayensis subsp. aureolus]
MRTLRNLLITLLACTGLALHAAPVASAQTTYPRCYVVSTYGTGTLTPGKVGTGYGTGTLTLEALYADPYNRDPDFFEYTYIDKAAYKAGATTADYETFMTVNGQPVNVSPHPNHSPGYWLHGEWVEGWRDSAGLWHPWNKGDRITVRVTVQFAPTLQGGWTEGSCIL